MGGAKNLHDGYAFLLARPAIERAWQRRLQARWFTSAGSDVLRHARSIVCPPNCQELAPFLRPSSRAPVHKHGPAGPSLKYHW